MISANEVLTVEEVARYLRVHPMTVQRWCRTGDLPAAKLGRAYRIKKTDLDVWWAQRRPRPASERLVQEQADPGS
jgi:excisionase family DNA binding protein